MREERSDEKGGVDKIQWRWARRMECVNLVKRGRSGDNTRCSKRHEKTHQQGMDIGMNKRASKRLILSAPHLTTEGLGCRLMIGGNW
jgi:hypothetical protein